MVELNIRVSNSEQSLNYKHLLYDDVITLSVEDPVLAPLVSKAKEDFKGDVEDIVLKFKFIWE